MLIVSELVSYLIKYIVFIAIAVVGILCGARYKKNKTAQAENDSEMN